MIRTLLFYLKEWISSDDRIPMVLRGARQVGKTWLVRQLAKECQKELIELNFERQPALVSLFQSNNREQILLNLSTVSSKTIDINHTLLFLDEIQAAPELLAKLRWFAEDIPGLAVVAAGSLLEFVLEDHAFSMPVGRITYAHLEPLSFEEFLLANDKHSLFDYLHSYELKNEVPVAIHQQLSEYFKEYTLVGGMPAAVASWIKHRSLTSVNRIQHDLLATYRDDFAKYKGRIDKDRLDEVMTAIPKMLSQKFVYSKVNQAVQSTIVKQVVDLLCKARVCNRVFSTAANGVPLAAEVNDKYFKAVFLDVGLCCASLGVSFAQVKAVNNIELINNGGIAEQVVGQILRTIEPPYIEPRLYYWRREEAGSNAEVDYIIQHGNQVIPVEVKAGATGTLKSLHIFMGLKKNPVAVRVNADVPSVTPINVKTSTSEPIQYTLISVPFYLLGQIQRLL